MARFAQPRSKPHAVEFPLNAEQASNIDSMLEELYDDIRNGNLTIDASQVVSGILPVVRGGSGVDEFTAGSITFIEEDTFTGLQTFAEDNSNFFWDDTNNRLGIGTNTPSSPLHVVGAGIISTSLTCPILIGGTGVTSTLILRSTSGVGAVQTSAVIVQSGTDGATEIARFYRESANDYANLRIGTAAVASLGSGGNKITVSNSTSARSGGLEIATESTANGTDCGFFDIGTFGCPAAEKRAAAVHGFLEASAAATVTGSLRFYTTNAGTITEHLRITQTGRLQLTGRSKLASLADAHLTLTNAAESSGFGLQMGTADTMIVANQAQSAYATVDALAYKLSGVSGLTATALTFPTRTIITSPTNAQLTITNNASSSGFGLQASTADTMIVANQAQNAYGTVDALKYKFSNTSRILSSSDGVLRLSDAAETAFSRLQFGGTTSSYPALKRSAAILIARLADDSTDAELQSLRISTNNAATFHTSRATLTDGAGVGAGTLGTAPAAGNPTKWIGVDDNGTTRYIPAW